MLAIGSVGACRRAIVLSQAALSVTSAESWKADGAFADFHGGAGRSARGRLPEHGTATFGGRTAAGVVSTPTGSGVRSLSARGTGQLAAVGRSAARFLTA